MRFIPLPKLSEGQIKEFLNDLLIELELKKGYQRASTDAVRLPKASDKIRIGATALRQYGARADVLRFGYVMNQRRLPQLWIYGVTFDGPNVQPNMDATAELLDPMMQVLLAESDKLRGKMPLSDLQARIINLSYVDDDGALSALRAMGFSAITDDDQLAKDDSYKGKDALIMRGDASNAQSAPVEVAAAPNPLQAPGTVPIPMNPDGTPFNPNAPPRKYPSMKNLPTSISFDQLPLIVKMPSPDARTTGLVGDRPDAASAGANSLGLTLMPNAATSLASTISAKTSQLLVLYDAGNIDQFLKVQRILDEVIDKPARQVFVEGLILEISKQGIEELGIQWQKNVDSNHLQLGSLVQLTPGAGATSSALSFARDTASKFDPKQFLAKVNALVDRQKAEILSRPSVLTLDNRQATIRVGTDIPIATSKDTGTTGERVAFSFQYLPTGILLNVRPRINKDGGEISMLIDATVSATVPGADLRVLSQTGSLLASAPTISTRRVQTYARINNNTPLIIGGLLSRDKTKQEDKVPGLGDIPLFGKLYGYESNKDAQREVIIVLTPSVLTEEFRATKPRLPKDDDLFDQADTTLFREAYRIRAEDLIDSQYIRINQRFLSYRRIANQVISRNLELANVEPFKKFQGNKVPGEFIFVAGEMHRMLNRLKGGATVNLDKLTFFEGLKGAEFKTETLGGLLKRMGNGSYKGFFDKHPGKALTLKFSYARASMEPGAWASEPLAEVKLVDCPDREAWKKITWDMNQPIDGIQKHYTIVIHDESDLERVKLAIALKNTILANGNADAIIFDNFLPGRMLAMQEVSPEWERTLEATIGRYFFYGEFFYPAFTDELERSIKELDAKLRDPAMAPYLEGIKLP